MNLPGKLRIGTRGSHLARTQATTVAAELAELGYETELVIISTAGDRSAAKSFADIGPTGVFVHDIEQALLDNAIDVAVHSFKDLPTESPPELTLAAIPQRLDASDTLIMTREAMTEQSEILPLKAGARVGTASARRQAWVKHLRPDLIVEPIRGNVPTRIGRLDDGFDGIIVAAAGVDRLQDSALDDRPELHLDERIVARLDPTTFVPAPAQGALALQCRAADEDLVTTLSVLAHGPTQLTVAVERALLAKVEGGCDVAFGAYCKEASRGDGTLELFALLERDGRLIAAEVRDKDPIALVDMAWETLRDS
jgi:hydroxymethylbilane synthase